VRDSEQCCSSEVTAVLLTLCCVCDSGDSRQCCSNSEVTAMLVTLCCVLTVVTADSAEAAVSDHRLLFIV
jgi:hypothetical protein